ncbi:MAG: TPM domain-containing protein [Castellaniella sp.]
MGARFWKRVTGLAWLQANRLRWHVFTPAVLAQIAERIRHGEADHGAEVVLAVEPVAPGHERHPRQRALEVFGRLQVWDTPENTGVLLYLALDRGALEIIADRGIAATDQQWLAVCQRLQQKLHAGEYLPGLLAAIDDMHAILRDTCPPGRSARDENVLPDEPVML